MEPFRVMANQLVIVLTSTLCFVGMTEAVVCYKCAMTDPSCTVTTDRTEIEQCDGRCLTRFTWRYHETLRYINASRSCEPTCNDRVYNYGYFDSVEDFCCQEDACNQHTVPSNYNKCHYCTGNGKDSCPNADFVRKSPDSDAPLFCVGQCTKVISDGKDGEDKIDILTRSCSADCKNGTTDLLDKYGDKVVGTIKTYCCTGDMCNTGSHLGAILNLKVQTAIFIWLAFVKGAINI